MMKTTIPGLILGGMMVFTLAACNTTPMNSDGAMGSSSTGMTAVGDPAKGDDNITARGAASVNCATNMAADGTNAADNPGARCPTESH
jgi:hypothetical protein